MSEQAAIQAELEALDPRALINQIISLSLQSAFRSVAIGIANARIVELEGRLAYQIKAKDLTITKLEEAEATIEGAHKKIREVMSDA